MPYKMPIVGDRLLYFANGGDPVCSIRSAPLPAIVTQVEGSHITLTIFTGRPESPAVVRTPVVHKEEALDRKGKPESDTPYWLWTIES